MSRDFHLPDLGEGIIEAQIIQVMVKEGEHIAEDQSLFEVETDKAAVEIPSPYEGKAEKVHVTDGQTVNVGDVMITFDGAGKSAPAKAEKSSSRTAAEGSAASAAGHGGVAVAEPPATSSAQKTTAAAAPAVRKFAREMGVNIDNIHGTGPGGRVTKADVQAAGGGGSGGGVVAAGAASSVVPASQPVAASAPAPTPALLRTVAGPPPGTPDTDKWGSIRRSPLAQIRKTIAKQMNISVSTIPHVTHIDEIDVTEMENMRKQYKEAYGGQRRVTAMAFIIHAVCRALKNYPIFNATLDLDAGETIYKEYINIGVAVDTERGLVVPNIRNADQMSVSMLAGKLGEIAASARESKFAIEDLRGGTFTLTNVGALGGTFSTPIINHPEVAILGLGKAQPKPWVHNGEIAIRTILPFSLSFDHRVADGAEAARFCGELKVYLSNPVTLLV